VCQWVCRAIMWQSVTELMRVVGGVLFAICMVLYCLDRKERGRMEGLGGDMVVASWQPCLLSDSRKGKTRNLRIDEFVKLDQKTEEEKKEEESEGLRRENIRIKKVDRMGFRVIFEMQYLSNGMGKELLVYLSVGRIEYKVRSGMVRSTPYNRGGRGIDYHKTLGEYHYTVWGFVLVALVLYGCERVRSPSLKFGPRAKREGYDGSKDPVDMLLCVVIMVFVKRGASVSGCGKLPTQVVWVVNGQFRSCVNCFCSLGLVWSGAICHTREVMKSMCSGTPPCLCMDFGGMYISRALRPGVWLGGSEVSHSIPVRRTYDSTRLCECSLG
jgi:hypothetical protein